MSRAFDRMATVTAATKRPPSMSGGRRGSPVDHLSGFACLPLDPVSADTVQRLGLQTPVRALQTVTKETDIKEGDVLVVDGEEYVIRSVSDWEWRAGSQERFSALVVEREKV